MDAEILSMLIVPIFLWILFGAGLCFWVVYNMAVRYNREGAVWVAIAFLFTPIVAIIYLWALGEDTNPRRELPLEGQATIITAVILTVIVIAFVCEKVIYS